MIKIFYVFGMYTLYSIDEKKTKCYDKCADGYKN